MTQEHLELSRRQCMDANGFGPRVMMQIKVCPVCGTVGAASRFFCKACSHWLPRHSLYHRYQEKHPCCPTCGTVLADSARYCPQCGTRMKQSTG